MDENGKSFILKGFSRDLAERVIEFIEIGPFDWSWNICPEDKIVKDKSDPRIVRGYCPMQKQYPVLLVYYLIMQTLERILCMCDPDSILGIEQKLKEKFSSPSIVKSSNILLEIMQDGVTKGNAVKDYVTMWDISLSTYDPFWRPL